MLSNKIALTLALALFFAKIELSAELRQVRPLPIETSLPSSTTVPRSEPIVPFPPIEKSQKNEAVKRAPPTPYRQKEMVKAVANYFHPGVLVFKDNEWIGGDYLYNLTGNLSVYVTILAPSGDLLNLSEDSFKKNIEKMFVEAGLNPSAKIEVGKPALPFFQIQILLYPFGQGYAASCKASLYESVELKRSSFELGTAFQAITWERESLIVAPVGSIVEQLQTSVTETTQAFLERFKYYQ